MQNKIRDMQKDMVAASERNNIDTIESIVLVEENNMQDEADICIMIATHYNKKHCLSYVQLEM